MSECAGMPAGKIVMRLIPLFLVVLGISVSGLGLTKLIAALIAAPGDPVVAAMNDDRPVSAAALDRLLESRRAALAWSRSPQFYRDMARAAWRVARRAGQDRDRASAALRLATDATESGLRISPVDPSSWLQLAVIRLDADADPQAALTALRSAIVSGPYDPYRTEARVRLVLRLWWHLDSSDRLLFQPQFRHLWLDDPDSMAQLALDPRAHLIALAMLDDPESAATLGEMRDELLQSRQ